MTGDSVVKVRTTTEDKLKFNVEIFRELAGVTFYVFLCVFFTLPIGPLLYPVIYVVVNPVRGLLHRKISEEHLQSSNESMETKTKAKQKLQNERNKNTKHMPEK